jgi:hypothetical protein
MGNDGEVKIHVAADSDLSQIEAAQRKIKELYRAAAVYEEKGIGTAASSARADAKSLERDVARFTRERAQAERAVTREMREQTAERKAGVATGGVGRAAALRNAVAIGQDLAQGGPQGAMGGLMNAGMAGGPAAMAAAVAAAVGAAIVTTLAKEADRDTAQGLGIQREGFMRSYKTGRQAGIFGSSGALVSSALSATDEIEQRKAMRGEIDERARQKWHDPSSWTWGGLRKNEGMREREKNEAAIQQAEAERERSVAAAKEKFVKEEGGLELRALRGRAQRTLEGSREAFKAELGGEWLSKYKSVLTASGDEGMAKEMADLTVGNKLRDMQANAGAGLVDSRSGGAGIAAAAQWSTQAFPEMVGELKNLHSTVQNQANPLEKLSK